MSSRIPLHGVEVSIPNLCVFREQAGSPEVILRKGSRAGPDLSGLDRLFLCLQRSTRDLDCPFLSGSPVSPYFSAVEERRSRGV